MGANIFWGGILRALRKKWDLSQKEVAYMIGVSRQTYSAYETGKIHPTPEVIAILSEIYNTDISSYAFAMFPDSLVAETAEYRKAVSQRKKNDYEPGRRRVKKRKVTYFDRELLYPFEDEE